MLSSSFKRGGRKSSPKIKSRKTRWRSPQNKWLAQIMALLFLQNDERSCVSHLHINVRLNLTLTRFQKIKGNSSDYSEDVSECVSVDVGETETQQRFILTEMDLPVSADQLKMSVSQQGRSAKFWVPHISLPPLQANWDLWLQMFLVKWVWFFPNVESTLRPNCFSVKAAKMELFTTECSRE